MTLKPRLQALVLADQIYVDATTKKRVIAGTFNALWAKSFPTTFGRSTWAYVSLTDIRGKVTLVLRFVDNSDLKVLMQAQPIIVEGNEPHATLELGLSVPQFPMPHEGSYSFELHANDEKIGSVRLTMGLIQQEQKE